MAGQSIVVDFIGRGASNLAGDFRKTGDSAVVAAQGARLLGDALEKQRKAADVSAGATLASAKADKILADAEEVLSGRAIEAELALKRQAAAAKDAGDKSKAASGGVSALAGGGGIPGGGMGALIGAGALLSPILVTLGFGLAGFGAAAAGAILPIENAAKKTGGLQANMKLLDPEQQAVAKSILALGDQYAAFQLKLKPEVLGVFGKGLSLAGHLMQDVEPVAAATGKALGGLIGQIDAEFRSNNWQNFFHFMAQTAGPDIKLLGDAFVSLTGDLPTLLEGLQPVAEALLTVVNYTGQAIRLSELASTNFSSLGKSTQQSGDGFNATTTGLKAVVPGLQAADNFARELGQGIDILYGNSGKAAKGTQDLAAKARDEAAASKAQTAEINKLNAAVTTHIAKILTLEGDEVSWKQAQQAATTAINANKHALDGNSTSALAARAAIIQSTSAVIKFADDSNTSTGALRRGSSALQDQVTWLERHAGKSKIAADEIRALREEEAKIKREIDQRINVQGTGRFSVAGAGLPGGIGHRTGATGGRVPGFGGGDVHPYLLEGGEAIVPKHLTPAVAPFLKAQGVPGFATGGIIPDYRGGIPGLGPWAVGNTQTTLRLLDQSVASAVAAAVRAAATAFAGPTGGSTGPGAAAAQSWMRAHMGDYGWSAAQFPALQALWNGESGWRWNAQNPTSPAYGIPQADPGSKMAAAGADWRTNPVTQMRWGAEYIRETPGYGTPSATYAKWLARNPHWYGSGLDATFSSPTLIGVGERGPERVQVTPGTGSGGNTYNITVHVPPSANQAEIGRHLVTAIGAFEKRSGKGWRK